MFRSIFIWVWLFLFSGCTPDLESSDSEKSITTQSQQSLIEVSAIIAEKRPFQYLIQTPATIQSKKHVNITSRKEGILSQVFVSNNQYVRRGTVLVKLSNDKEILDLEMAKIFLEEKKIDYQNLLLGFGNNANQIGENGRTISDNLRINSGLNSAEIAVKQAELEISYSTIRAPISGTVVNFANQQFNPVGMGDVICQIYDSKNLVTNAKVLESELAALKKGQKAKVSTIAFPNMQYDALIEEINPMVDENGMVSLRFKLIEPKKLVPGMNATIEIRIALEKNIIVPKTAIIIRSGRPVIFTIENGVAQWNYVSTGRENGLEIEVLDGISTNDSIVISNNLQLAHNTPVRVTTQSP